VTTTAPSPPTATGGLEVFSYGVLGIDWRPAVSSYLTDLYPTRTPARHYIQPSLFEDIAS
jgi:hypothetical protein